MELASILKLQHLQILNIGHQLMKQIHKVLIQH
nr:MAG TPA: hypothetical protein [Caudoviricetes sp.]